MLETWRKARRVGEARELLTSSRGHRSRAIRRIPPSKKVLDERRPPAPWILLTKDPEPSPALPEGKAEMEAKRCTWTYDETHCAWDSSCGEKLILEDGGPNENRIRFCHGCGKPVEVACEAPPEKARQP